MRKVFTIIGIVLCIVLISIIVTALCHKANQKSLWNPEKHTYYYTERTLKEQVEKAYFEGQKDAIEGDIRIMKNEGGCWYWIKSPWDDGTTPIYNLYQECDSVKLVDQK